jgi:hypothetical protein
MRITHARKVPTEIAVAVLSELLEEPPQQVKKSSASIAQAARYAALISTK